VRFSGWLIEHVRMMISRPPSAPKESQGVYLNGANGLTAGWYTLLPAKYALLPGGMRVVEETGATNPAMGTSLIRSDGGLIVSGIIMVMPLSNSAQVASPFVCTSNSGGLPYEIQE